MNSSLYDNQSRDDQILGEAVELVKFAFEHAESGEINLSETENLITLMWANEQFDPAHPDTYSEEV